MTRNRLLERHPSALAWREDRYGQYGSPPSEEDPASAQARVDREARRARSAKTEREQKRQRTP